MEEVTATVNKAVSHVSLSHGQEDILGYYFGLTLTNSM
jgi:hypothetical protein